MKKKKEEAGVASVKCQSCNGNIYYRVYGASIEITSYDVRTPSLLNRTYSGETERLCGSCITKIMRYWH